MSNSVLIIGSSNTDMVIKVPELPLPGETILGGAFFMNSGGKGANQAVAAARLGAKVRFIARLGNDVFGQSALNSLSKEDIDLSFMAKDELIPSGVALILVNEKGENSIAVASGANGLLSEKDVDPGLNNLAPNALVLIQLESPIKTVEYVAEKAHMLGARVILNPAPAQILTDSLMRNLFAITPNQSEAQALTGIQVIGKDSAATAAEILHAKGIECVIITMGAQGAFLSMNQKKILIPAPKVSVIDTTAAGDTFNGALVVALSEGKPMEQAVNFACQAAGLSVTRMGAQASIPKREELWKFTFDNI